MQNSIVAFIIPSIWVKVMDILKEGHVFLISNFVVRNATGSFRPVRNLLCINFTEKTQILHLNDSGVSIPLQCFHFSPLSKLANIHASYLRDKSPEFSLGTYYWSCISLSSVSWLVMACISADLIGVVQHLEQPRLVGTIYDDMILCRFSLTAGRYIYASIQL